jgi:formylglycine-generating enzyme required for sulfatase activity
LSEAELMAAEDDAATFARVIALLVDRRLLTASSNAAGPERRLDISHEALLAGWPKLRQWMDEHRLDELVYRRLSGDAEEWKQNNFRATYLYEGDRLREAERWSKDHADALSDLDLRFLHAGRIKRLRTSAAWAGAVLAVLLLITIAGLAYTGTLNRLLYRPPSLQWMAIPGDRFLMGSTPDEVAAADAMDAADLAKEPDVLGYDFSGEQPAHWVELSPYQIMRYEVTRAEYHQCQRAGVCDASSPPLSVTGVDGALPVTGVSLEKAATFCQFIGGSLPTEAQWELAARGAGAQHRLYPWGNEPDPARANVKSGAPKPVGSYGGGESEYGVADMAGNVWEWVSDFYAPYEELLPPGTSAGGGSSGAGAVEPTPLVDPTGPPSGNALLIRGGSFDNDWVKARSASRLGTIDLGRAANDIGFRCVRSVHGTE